MAGGNAALRSDGGASIQINMKKTEMGGEKNAPNVLSRVIAHEGQHGVDDQARGRTSATRAERKDAEVNGYTAQATYQKAANFAVSARDGWTPFGGMSPENIDRQAEGSIAVSCGASQEGSCQ